MFELLIAEKLRLTIYREFALADAAEAHRVMERGETLGKMILKVNGDRDGNG